MKETKVILLNNRPKGKPQSKDFKFTTETISELEDGHLLVKTKYVSVDPYLRGRMRDQKSYVAPFELNQPIVSGIVGEVIESKNQQFAKGDFVAGRMEWKEMQVVDGTQIHKVSKEAAPLSAYLGVLGMTGLTAYFGLKEIAKLKEGETILVSGAAGAVGSVVGQIAKTKGCRVVGVAGSEEKIAMLIEEFGFDDAFNYKTNSNLREAIAQTCPNGIDVFWDNVGGDLADAVFFHINQFARIVNCGAISVYNDTEVPKGVSPQPFLIKNSASMEGFIVSNYQDHFDKGIKALTSLYKEGKLQHEETIVEGFDNIPQAFIDLFDGKNKGKMVVKI